MAAEIKVPFDGRQHPLGSLEQIFDNGRLAQVAVKSDDAFVSLNFHEFRAGDVVLFKSLPTEPLDTETLAIRAYQAVVLDNPGARAWEHVGILDRNFQIWDAMPSLHVRCRALREVILERSIIAVVRPQVFVDPTVLDERLLDLSNHEYRFFHIETGGAIIYRFAARVLRVQAELTIPNNRVVICSTFVAHALNRAANYFFFRSLPVVLPGDFAQDEQFSRVELRWCNVAAMRP